MQVKWKKLNNYCIEFEDYIICKYKTQDKDRFILWNGERFIKVFDTAQEAKNETLALNRTKLAVSN